MGISSMLPTTGYIKMIDIWMIFTMAYPFLIISLHCIKEVCWNFLFVKKLLLLLQLLCIILILLCIWRPSVKHLISKRVSKLSTVLNTIINI